MKTVKFEFINNAQSGLAESGHPAGNRSFEVINGGVYTSIGGTTVSITAGSDGITILLGGQVAIGPVVSGSGGININWNGEVTPIGQTGVGVGTPTGTPGVSFSWTTDLATGDQTIQIGFGPANDVFELGVQFSFKGILPNGQGIEGDPFTGMPWSGNPDDWGNGFDGAQNTTSPIVLDLNGDGVKTTKLSKSFTAGVHFNLDAKGFAENTGWVDAQDGLLVRDLDGNGQITSGRELFGNHTLLTQGANAGKEAANGFEALKELDGNNDGEINASDAAFNTLRVWKDANGNGSTDAGELLSLAQAGVKSLKVAYTNTPNASADAQGNTAQQTGSYTSTSDATRDMSDVWFAVDSARSAQGELVAVSDTIAALPDFAHMGNLHSLHQAMARDASGQLQALVARYEAEALSPTRDALLQDILYHWAGVQGVDPASRVNWMYGNAIGDARKLAFLEALLGRGYLGTWCWGERDPNPHGPAAAKLLALYENVKTFYGAQLDAQTVCQDDLAALRLSWDEGTQSFGWDASQVVANLRTEYDSQPDQVLQHVARLGQVFKQMGNGDGAVLKALQALGDVNGDALAQALFQAGSEQLIFTGTTVADKLVGNSANNHFHALATKFRCRSRAHLQRTTKLNVRH